MKSVSVRYFALFREQAKKSSEILQTKASSGFELYLELAQLYGFSLASEQVRLSVNDCYQDMQQPLGDGDRVVFIPPVAGG